MNKKQYDENNLNLTYKDLWIPIKYCRNPIKNELSIFKIFNQED